MECPILTNIYNTNPQKADQNNVFSQFRGNLNFDVADSFTIKDDVKARFELVYSKQGPIEKVFDSIKNLFKTENSSNSVKNTLKLYEEGQVSKETAEKALKNYVNSQTKSLEFIADCASTYIGGAAFALLRKKVPNADLLTAMFLAGATGSAAKIGVKAADSKMADRKYTTLAYDITTGAINGLLCPVANGAGNKAAQKTGEAIGAKPFSELKSAPVINDDALTKLLTTPRQKTNGNILQKFLLYGISKLIKCGSKFGLAFVLRESVFEMQTEKFLNKSLIWQTASWGLSEEEKEKLNQSSPKAPTNDIYGVELKKAIATV